MRNLSKLCIVLMILSGLVFNVNSQTLKERIDEAKTVKVYFNISDIKHEPNTNAMPGSQKKGTGCKNFTETTALPANYVDVVKQIVDQLNKGFNTTAFVAGNITTVPLVEKGLLKGSQDWLKHGEPLVFTVYAGGTYTVNNVGLMGEVKLSNSLSITSGIGVFAIINGKIKSLTVKNLGSVSSAAKESKTCGDYDYFVKNFPVADFFDKFKESHEKNVKEFTEKEMAKYDKEMKKKK